jgi:tetratricopeptide (TPR) repeat protein
LLGQALRQSGKLDEAANELDAATAIAPKMIDAWRARLDIKRRIEGVAAARALAESLSDRIGPAEMHALEGDLSFAEKQYAEAAKSYRAQYDEQPSSQAVLSLSNALVRAGQSSEAVSLLMDWLAHHPDDNEARFALSTDYIQSGQLDAAQAESERILAKAPDFAANLNNLAWLYDQKGDAEKALKHARRAYELAPKRPEIADTLGWILIRQGDAATAMPLLDQAWRAAPDNPEIGYHYAAALSKDGKMAQAKEVVTKVLQSPNAFPERKDAEKLSATLKAP